MDQRSPGILIADDEPALLKIMKQYLQRLGYEVSGFETGREAWEEFRAHPSAYGLFIADATLRDAAGEEVLADMRVLNPGVAFLISSGYPVDLTKFRPDLRKRTAALQKPFTPRMLAEAVRKLLGGDEAAVSELPG